MGATGPVHRARLGIVGAGQLARMTVQAAVGLGLTPRLLAADPSDSAALVDPDVVLGDPGSLDALRALARSCDVATLDHELVDPAHLAALEAEGYVLRPGAEVAAMVVDKRHQRALIARGGAAQPAWRAIDTAARADGSDGVAGAGGVDRVAGVDGGAGVEVVEAHAREHGWPVVVKAARGGYDGRGVRVVDGPQAAREAVADLRPWPLLVEEGVVIRRELAVQVVRRPTGETVTYPVVETVQRDGICREVLLPAPVAPDLAAAARDVAVRLAEASGVVGVLAVELFESTDGRLLVNELAARPHNSGHHTIESCVTSQFENHLRAVLDLPLGDASAHMAAAASVNVLGPASGRHPDEGLAAALAVPGAHVHLYAKQVRPGRKLGHVTVCGDDPAEVRARAWAAVVALTGEGEA